MRVPLPENRKLICGKRITLLIAHGNTVKHYGDPDPGLARFGIDQTGAIKQFLG